MKRSGWLILIAGLMIALLSGGIGATWASLADLETSEGNLFQAWASTAWTQTSQADFEAGVPILVDTSSSPGDVVLGEEESTPALPVALVGSWTGQTDYDTYGFNYTPGAGSDRVALVLITAESNSNPVANINHVTLGGQTLAIVQSVDGIVVGSAGSYHNLIWLGYLTETSISNMSGDALNIYWDTSPTSSPPIMVQAATYQYVDQAAPVADSASNTNASASSIQAGSVSVGENDRLVYVSVCGNPADHSAPGGYTEQREQDGPVNSHSSASAQRDATTAGTENPSAAWNTTSRLAIISAVLKAAAGAGGGGEDWYDTDWPYRREITIDHTLVSNVSDPAATYAGFPVLVYATGLSNINANGTDIRFTASNGTTELPREIESYSGGTLYAWVKFTLTKDAGDSSDDAIYMYYGNTSAAEPDPGSSYGSQNVWDSHYQGVWHLKEDNPGTANLETLRPDAAGDETAVLSQSPFSGAHYDKVDDVTPDDSNTYIYTGSTSYQRDLYGLPDHTAAGTINGVTVWFRFYSPGFYHTTYARASIKTNGTVYDGTERSVSSGWENDSQTWTINPSTGADWTWDEIDELQAGVSLRTSSYSDPVRCTQVYVEVDYNLYGDSTSKANDGKDQVSSTDKTGRIGSGQGFDGSDDWIDIDNDTSLQLTTVTVGAWCKPTVTGVYMGIGGKLQDVSDAGFAITKADTNKFRFQTATGGLSTIIESNSDYNDTDWHYVVGVRSGGVNYLYVDGVQQTETSTAAITDSGLDAHIGVQYQDYDGRRWNGNIDEFRISDTGRSSQWIQTEYNNQYAPASFCQTGQQEEPDVYASAGTLASPVLDTGIAGARWDGLFWDVSLPFNTDITFEVRACDASFAKDAPAGTLPWNAVSGTSPVTSGLPTGRYMQWRATLTTSDQSTTPTLREVRLYHY
jgi:hypothetical protein